MKQEDIKTYSDTNRSLTEMIKRLRAFCGTDSSKKTCLDAAAYIESVTNLLAEKTMQIKNALTERNEYKQAGEQACRELEATAKDIERYKRALAKMWFAYENKDSEPCMRHEYEIEAVAEAEALLGQWSDCMPSLLRRKDEDLLWCDEQVMCVEGITCAAHLAEGRAFACPYKNPADRERAEYPCCGYKPVKKVEAEK